VAFPKTYRTNAGWALSIGAILALFSNLRNEQRAVISLAIIGALGFLWSAWEHEWIRWNRKSILKVTAILGFFFLIAWFVWPLKLVPAPPAVAIFADCTYTDLPVSIPPRSTIHLVSLNRKFMLSRDWGLYDFTNSTDTQAKWPSEQQIRLNKPKTKKEIFFFNASQIGYKCDISNHSQLNVFDVAIPMRFWFGNKGGEENAIKYTPILSPLDAGSHFVFYIVNDCPLNVAGVLPDTVTIAVAGEAARRSVRLNLPHRSPTSQQLRSYLLLFNG